MYFKPPSTVKMYMNLDVYFIITSKKQCLEMNGRKTVVTWGWGRGKSPKWTHLHFFFTCEIDGQLCSVSMEAWWAGDEQPSPGRTGWLARPGFKSQLFYWELDGPGQRPPSVCPVSTMEDETVLLSYGYGNTWLQVRGLKQWKLSVPALEARSPTSRCQ